jgi:LysR family transcriptional regulator (chromosome initiation inhibitor)
VHYVPTAEGFGAAVRAGLGWGMYPEQLVNADFVQITDVHLDVPLYWQSWKMDSVLVGTVGAAVLDAAAALR